MLTKDKTDWAYLAGIIDGEGHLTISSHRVYPAKYVAKRNKSGVSNAKGHVMYALHLGVTNTNLDLIKWLVETFGGYYSTRKKMPKKNKQRYDWKASGSERIELILLAVLPYLKIKRKQAIVALQYVRMSIAGEQNREKRQQLLIEIQRLNGRKESPTTNTQEGSLSELKIESELTGDRESAPVVTLVA